MTKVQSFPLLRTALVGESGDEAATPLSFPHINQDEANQAKFNRKEHCSMDGLTLPCTECAAAPEQRAGDGPEHSTSLNLCLSRVWSKAAIQNPPEGNEGFSHLRIRTGKKGRESEGGRGEERKEQRKNKKSGRVKEREGPLNVTSPALWNGFSLMLTT